MKVLVTGANGFLGHHVVRMLLERGYAVRAFVLAGTSEENLAGLTCEIQRGTLLEEKDIVEALQGCEYLIHTAAITDVWPSRNKLSWSVNYEVVKRLAHAVMQSNIRKYIHVGTANSFGFGSKEKPGTELSPYNGKKYGLDYMDSKQAAQDYLLQEAVANKLPVTIINPTFMIGEGDEKPGTGEMILSVIAGKVPGYAAGGRCFAAVKDVALACVNAMEHGAIGECYITGGINLNYREFFALIGDIASVKPPNRKVPSLLAIVFAGLLELIATIRHKKPMLTVSMAKISKDGHYYSSDKAREQLSYPQTNLINALTEAIDWYDKHGYIERWRSQ